jgi:hypothetical protein
MSASTVDNTLLGDMALKPIQLVRIAALRHDGGGVSDYERLRLIADIESSEELHRLVLGAPQSMSGAVCLAAIVEHPRCSEGTAFLIYWALCPALHYRLLKKRKPFSKRNEDVWKVLMKIEERVRTKQYTGDPIQFSFAAAIDRPFDKEAVYNPGILSVPEFTRSNVAGCRIE